MKTMTCRDLGGPCDAEIQGETVDEMVANGAMHLQTAGDEAHKPALAMMEDMMNKPEEAQKWNEEFAKKFAELPES